MPIRKFTNGRFSLKRFTAPGVGTGSLGGTIFWNTASGLIRTYNYGDVVARPIAANVDVYSLAGNAVVSLAPGSTPLPPGLSVLANGMIYGTVNTTYSTDVTNTFTLLATNSLSGTTDQRTFSITIKAPVTANYNYTGSDQTLTLPAGVNTFVVHAWGGGGAGFPGAPFVGGAGGYTTAVVTNVSNANSFVVKYLNNPVLNKWFEINVKRIKGALVLLNWNVSKV